MEETIAKQNKKLDDLFSKLSDDKINITETNTPTKNIYEEKSVSEDLTKESKLKKEKISKKLDAQLIAVRKKYKEHYYKNYFSKTQPSKTNSNNFSFTEENVETINNELDDSNLRGLHLNIKGNKMFARNLLNAIRNWYNVGSSI